MVGVAQSIRAKKTLSTSAILRRWFIRILHRRLYLQHKILLQRIFVTLTYTPDDVRRENIAGFGIVGSSHWLPRYLSMIRPYDLILIKRPDPILSPTHECWRPVYRKPGCWQRCQQTRNWWQMQDDHSNSVPNRDTLWNIFDTNNCPICGILFLAVALPEFVMGSNGSQPQMVSEWVLMDPSQKWCPSGI